VRLGGLISLLAPPLCWGCSGPVRSGEPLCAGCRSQLRPPTADWIDVQGIPFWAATTYEGPARAMVAALKFRGATAVADAMAARIAALAGLSPGATLVPVPLHAARRRRRGYNQAELLAAALGRRIARPVVACLVRAGRDERPQMGRSRAERTAAPAGTIRIADGSAAPEHALLVDDVATTGATLGACAAALREAGASTVAAVAFARTPGR
jgi:ComF family protein